MPSPASSDPFPLFAYILFEVVFSFCLAVPKCVRKILCFPTLFALYAYLITSTTHFPLFDFCMGLQLTVQVGRAFDFLLLVDTSEESFKKVDEIPHGCNLKSPRRRLLRSFELMHSPRGIGWNWEVTHVSYSGCSSKGNFLRSRTLSVLNSYLILDALGQIEHTFFSGTSTRDDRAAIVFIVAWGYAVAAYLLVGLIHTIPTIPMVALKLESPANLPAYMGPVEQINSLRGLWGWTWHQSGRRTITSVASWLTTNLPCSQKNTTAGVYIRVCTGFALGAFAHAVAGWMAGSRDSSWDQTGSIEFFAWQLSGVIFEDVAYACLLANNFLEYDPRQRLKNVRKTDSFEHASQSGLFLRERIIGYLWTFFWIGFTLPPYIEGLSKAGVIGPQIMPFSVLGWAIQRGGAIVKQAVST